MNTKKDLYFIAFISLLVLNMLLIFLGVFSYFFKVNEYTIIAGIIAFVGAIIGGTITLIGVNRTIEHNRLQNRIDKIPMKLRKVVNIKLKLQELRNMYEIANQAINIPRDEANKMAMGFIQKHELVVISAELSTELYKGTYDLYNELILLWKTYSNKAKYCESCKQELTKLINMYGVVEKELQKELDIDDSYKTN